MNALIPSGRQPPFKEATLDAFLSALRSKLAGRVESAFLFGSLAQGHWDSDSDVDLILVLDTDTPFTQRGGAFLDLYDLAPRLDLLVYTPAEFEALQRARSLGFWESVLSQLKRIV